MVTFSKSSLYYYLHELFYICFQFCSYIYEYVFRVEHVSNTNILDSHALRPYPNNGPEKSDNITSKLYKAGKITSFRLTYHPIFYSENNRSNTSK